MKKMKKLASLVLALAMALTLAVPAMAAEGDTYTITINNETAGHTYEAYQIFAGDLARASNDDNTAGTSAVLSNIVWGENISADGQTALGNAATVAKTITNADEFAKRIDDYLVGEPAESVFDGSKYTISGLEAGYYLIKDKDGSVTGHDSYTKYIIEVVENSTVDPKDGTTTFEKKVKDINDSETTQYTNWQDSADHDIGDRIPFQLKATLPTNYADYEHYYLAFHDQESEGLTFNNDVKVYVDGNKITTGYTVVENPTDGCTFEVVFADLKAIEGINASSVITVEYTSTLNENAVLGSAGNPNTAYLEYSNNPNSDYNGEGKDDETGKTPPDKVIVFTYKVVVNKTDGTNPLKGAGFTLYKYDAETQKWVVVPDGEEDNDNEILMTAGSQFSWKGLDDGDYKLVETTTPAGYNTIDPIEFTIAAEHDVESDNPTLTNLTGGDKFTGEVSTGTLTASVVNNSGATLPETGGMGTTLFYALGAVLVIGAGVAMVTKKRMG